MNYKDINLVIESMIKIQELLKNYKCEFNMNSSNGNCLAILHYKDSIPNDISESSQILAILESLRKKLKIQFNHVIFNQNIIAIQFASKNIKE